MSISQILRRDLFRVFRGQDPLDHIEDIRIEETTTHTDCVVRFKIPEMSHYYVSPGAYAYTPVSDTLRKLTDEHMRAVLMGQWDCCPPHLPPLSESPGVCKAPKKDPPKPVIPEEKKLDPMDALKPGRIIYSGPKTIVFWPDGTKTMVSRMEGQEHDEYGAFCAAVVKKMFGATHKAKKFLNTVKVNQEPKPKKAKEEPEMVPMPGTTDPDWGEKHWGKECHAEEVVCNDE